MNFNTIDELEPDVAENLGWIPEDKRTDECKEACDKAVAEMPTFAIYGDVGREPVPFKDIASDHVFHWDAHKAVNGGKHLLTTYQRIGSCVGHGKYNAERGLMCLDIWIRKDNEQYVELFEPYGYGRSRFHAGIRGKGSGSTGSGAAKAARVDGVLRRDIDGLAGWRESSDTIEWSAAVDTEWSDGARIEDKWIQLGRKQLVQSTAQVNSASAVKDAILNGYPCTIASSWGGQMRPSVRDGVLLNRRTTTWMHQMSIHGWMLHKSLGELFYVWNSWGADTHGTCPTGAPPGGFWVTAADMDYICRQGDSFAFSQFDGFPAQKLDFNVIG